MKNPRIKLFISAIVFFIVLISLVLLFFSSKNTSITDVRKFIDRNFPPDTKIVRLGEDSTNSYHFVMLNVPTKYKNELFDKFDNGIRGDDYGHSFTEFDNWCGVDFSEIDYLFCETKVENEDLIIDHLMLIMESENDQLQIYLMLSK